MNFDSVKLQVIGITSNADFSHEAKLIKICELLNTSFEYYNWVGFYFANHESQTLHLGPYVGAFTDHTIIPFGKGICGQVALSNTNFIVSDVNAQDNYIACSFTVKSEVVIPILVDGINIGQIDIDSHFIDAFTQEDERFLEFVCKQISDCYVNSKMDFKSLVQKIVEKSYQSRN
jgi:L-methionine (R)-S-oxide reductase